MLRKQKCNDADDVAATDTDDGQSDLYVLALLKQAALKVSLTYDVQKIESFRTDDQNRLL